MDRWMYAGDVGAEEAAQARKWWWLFLITGIIWLLISLVILRFDITSVTAVGILAGVVVLIAGANELVAIWVATGWRWLHAILAVLFLITGIACLAYPGRTFVTIAWLFAWFLLFKGIFDIISAIVLRGVNPVWWLGLIAGIVEIGLAFWAAGYFGGSVALLIAWVGIGAMMRGVTEIILAFTLHKLGEEGAPETV